jgi:protein-L-isoaspartate O-methyltransferase
LLLATTFEIVYLFFLSGFLFLLFRLQAYHDRPFKKGSIHISAPHMYVTVLEALDLKPGNAFLNVGSGSGYLCCLAWCLLGEHGISHGIEISKKMVEYSRNNILTFHERHYLQHLICSTSSSFSSSVASLSSLSPPDIPVAIVHGNCFDIDISTSSTHCKYDRIYVGAGKPVCFFSFFQCF